MLRGEPVAMNVACSQLLASDLCRPRYHVSLARAAGRRLRRTYAWIFLIPGLAYNAKLAIHPTQLTALSDLWARAAVGPIRGEVVVAAGVVFHLSRMAFAAVTLRLDQRSWSQRQRLIAIG